jgi:hypothetical protein
MGVMANLASVERILFAVFTHENQMQGTATPFLIGIDSTPSIWVRPDPHAGAQKPILGQL